MGRLTNLNPPAPIADTDLPPSIARDTEIAAAIAAHLEATDPHSQYLNLLRGDGRYEYRALRVSKSIAGPVNFPENVWTSLGTIPGFSLGTQGEASGILVGICFLFDIRYIWQQASCVGLLSPVWWQPVPTADTGTRVPIEIHNQSGSYISIRASQNTGAPADGQGENRYIEIKPEISLMVPSGGRVDLTLKKLL